MNNISLGGIKKANNRSAIAAGAQAFYNRFNKERERKAQGGRNEYAQGLMSALREGDMSTAEKMFQSEEFKEIARYNPELASNLQNQYTATKERAVKSGREEDIFERKISEMDLRQKIDQERLRAQKNANRAAEAGMGVYEATQKAEPYIKEMHRLRNIAQMSGTEEDIRAWHDAIKKANDVYERAIELAMVGNKKGAPDEALGVPMPEMNAGGNQLGSSSDGQNRPNRSFLGNSFGNF